MNLTNDEAFLLGFLWPFGKIDTGAVSGKKFVRLAVDDGVRLPWFQEHFPWLSFFSREELKKENVGDCNPFWEKNVVSLDGRLLELQSICNKKSMRVTKTALKKFSSEQLKHFFAGYLEVMNPPAYLKAGCRFDFGFGNSKTEISVLFPFLEKVGISGELKVWMGAERELAKYVPNVLVKLPYRFYKAA